MKVLDKFTEGAILYECLFCGKCDRLVQQYWRLVFNTIKKTFTIKDVEHTIEDIEDLRIEVFMKLFDNNKKRLWKYDERRGSSLACWIMLITTRIVLNHIRSEIKEGNKESLTDDIQAEIEISGIEEYIPKPLLKDRIALLHEAIKMLSSRDRLIIKLLYYDELSPEDVAGVIDISLNALYAAKHNAIKRLARTVTKMLADETAEFIYKDKSGDENSLVYDVQIEIDIEVLKKWVAVKNFVERKKLVTDTAKMLLPEDKKIIGLFYFDKSPAEKCAENIATSVDAFYKLKHDAIKRLAKIVTEMLKKFL